MADLKTYYEQYNRDDPLSTYKPEDEGTFSQRLAWFSRYIPRGAKVLDYGCGEGVLLAGLGQLLQLHTDSCGVDISENAVRKAASRFPHLRFVPTSPSGAIPFGDRFFDAIVASEVIEHVLDTDAMFGEFRRVLQFSGFLFLSCPYHGFLKDLGLLLSNQLGRHYHDPYSAHVRYYSFATLTPVLKKHGFSITRRGGVGRLPFLWKSMVVAAIKDAECR